MYVNYGECYYVEIEWGYKIYIINDNIVWKGFVEDV